MSKNKKLNKHKGPLKLATKGFYTRRYEMMDNSKKLRGGFYYIALDSCSVINMAKLDCRCFDTSFSNPREKNLRGNLQELEQNSAIRHGFACERGKYVLCIVPAVLEEVDMGGKRFSQTIQRHLQEMYLTLEVKPEFQPQFDALTKKIMREFEKHDLFVSGFGNFMEQDAKIAAQAAIFNLAIASQDEHLVKASDGHRQHIRACCSKFLPGDHNGYQAVPMALCEIMELVRKDFGLPELENSFILTDKTRKQLERLKYTPSEYSKPNPALVTLQKPTNSANFVSAKASGLGTRKTPSVAFAKYHE